MSKNLVSLIYAYVTDSDDEGIFAALENHLAELEECEIIDTFNMVGDVSSTTLATMATKDMGINIDTIKADKEKLSCMDFPSIILP